MYYQARGVPVTWDEARKRLLLEKKAGFQDTELTTASRGGAITCWASQRKPPMKASNNMGPA